MPEQADGGAAANRNDGRRTLPIVLLAAVLVLAAVLRLDALTGRFGLVSQPGWLQALQHGSQTVVASIGHPAGQWQPEPEYPHLNDRPSHYRSDPYTYLKRAREMTSFYGAHYREPVFPFAVKAYLWLLGDQDVAVSFASASFSMLCVFATYLLGAMAFSRWAGCAAAFGMAIEGDVISWGVAGWRDDAFAFAVVLAACSMLYYLRKPSIGSAVVLGFAAALACLTRIFSVSFLAPAFLSLLLWSPGARRVRLRGVLVAAATATVLVAPYLVNCWRVYGDPLYTLNYQPLAYLEWEHADPSATPGAFGYIGEKLIRAPFRTLDTAALGMTSYPFLNKWNGFEPWLSGLGRWLAVLSLAGLVLFAALEKGRLLLLVLASAQVPFAFTWTISSDWRYTEFTYPFLLLAVGLVITSVFALTRPSWWRSLSSYKPSLKAIGSSVLALGGVALVAWIIVRVLPVLTFRETLLAERLAVIEAGPRDGSFFREGWSDWFRTYNVPARAARGEFSVVDVPLPRADDYDVTVRMDPFPPPADDARRLPAVRVFFNGVLLKKIDLDWNPEKVGSYDLAVSRSLAKKGRNQLVFTADRSALANSGTDDGASDRSFKLWYVLVRAPER